MVVLQEGGDILARKTYTSTEVKRRYNERVYTQVGTQIPKELATKFKEKCVEKDIPQRQVLIDAIERFVEDE